MYFYFRVPIMKNVNNLYKNTSMKLSTVAVVLLSAFGVSTLANAAAPEHFISVAPGAPATQGNYNNDGAKSDDSIAIGKNAEAGVSKDVAVGDNAKANKDTTSKVQNIGGATAIGTDTEAKGNGASALGYGAVADGANASALGNKANATGLATTAVGVSTQATGAYSVAVGSNAKATGFGSVSIGLASIPDTGATKNYAVSVGAYSGADVENGVALGSYSKATVNKEAVGYDPSTQAATTETSTAWKASHAAVSVGDVDNNITRQITSVAAGTKDTDAVNVAQLKSLDGKVEKNKTDIATNKADIATNKTNIATNTGNIATNTANIAANTGKITANTANIAANTGKITANTANIAANTANIQTNANNITAINTQLAANNNSINELRGNVNLLNKDLRGGVASAIAHASVPQSTKAGAIGVGVGTGFYGGQSAVSLGVSGVTPNENWVFKASVSTNSRGNYGVGAGALYQW
ncbi:Hep_Hag superfamily protein [Aggregatibacter segnis ATCC 33393]|uniref:Hep_Hag superfamily protein n=2 Tax=Aggregatibacter segnis TaxID=739 RepID=E6KYG6_9PAST|nr:Hep_Hag superfamily protein [Aggregatibacter segnis ATCC 33393]